MANIINTIEFKEPSTDPEFSKLDIRLQAILFAVSFYFKTMLNYQMVITDMYRNDVDSAHGHYRGADVRINSMPSREIRVPLIVDLINKNFPRHDKLPTAIAHGDGDNYHLHLQVPAKEV